MNIAALRLYQQQISNQRLATPAQIVAHLGGMQGQDLPGVKWSIGLRLPDAVQSDVDRAFDEGNILRTWPMRGTLHVVAAEDVRWMLSLTSPKNLSGSQKRRDALELDDKTLARCHQVFIQTLQGGKQKNRDEMYAALQAAGISVEGQRGYHILWNAALHGLICLASTDAKEQNYALLEEWVKPVKTKTRDEALAELAWRYFSSRGPATLKDFIWWSGLSATEARAGFEDIKVKLISETVGKTVYWMPPDITLPKEKVRAFALPGFDEYILGYQDRSVVLDPQHADKICPGGNGMFASTIVIDGQVLGTWKRTVKKNAISINTMPFDKLKTAEMPAFKQAATRYGAFMAMQINLES
ncbi:MAG: winged helix DNA-binding domain-containing protein [Sideroxydans sp.]|nr:winged helix DNA-binding domain-containing protein [Sideroxydans sp.]